MSERFDDAVVGAGILGLAHAYHLAERGRRVVVFERDRWAQGASIRNFGMIWPIGQPAGERRELALRSRGVWKRVLAESGVWNAECGSLHLAYREDEAQVLREFCASASAGGFAVEWLDAKGVLARSGGVNPSGLIGGMWSPTEMCVDPREVVAALPGWLSRRFGVRFEFDHPVTARHGSSVAARGTRWTAARLWVCSGDDLRTLFPGCFDGSGLQRTKLHMMRSQPYGEMFRIGPHLAGGLTLQHYAAFHDCPTLPALKERIERETPQFNRFGIHVMASQNGRGEITIGDSHEYGDDAEIFDKTEIDDLILSYLRTFLIAPDLRIAARWHGVYVKHPTEPFFKAEPAEKTVAVTGTGGAGMTLAFGIAEKVIRETLG